MTRQTRTPALQQPALPTRRPGPKMPSQFRFTDFAAI